MNQQAASRVPRARKARPARPAPAAESALQAGPQGPAQSVLGLQATAGNGAVQRLLQRRQGLIQREGGVIYMDDQGVGHKEPSKTKSHGVFHMDSQGVGHKEPDKTKSLGVIHMDSQGVGHKEPEKVPTRSTPFFMDAQGVGHDKPDGVRPSVQKAHKAIKGAHDKALLDANKVTTPMSAWAPRLLIATQKRAEAEAAKNAGVAVWDTEAVGSGLTAATEAGKSETAAAAAKQQADLTAGELAGVKAAGTEVAKWVVSHNQNKTQFAKDKARWLKYNSPMTTAAVLEIQNFLDQEAIFDKAASDLAATTDAEALKVKTASDEAAAFAKTAWSALTNPPSNAWTIVGMLQQKLNATRADGAAHLPVHALLDSATLAAMRAFQGTNGIPASNRADAATWTALDQQAPSIMQNGKLVVEAKGGAQLPVPLNGITRPQIKFGASGAAVKEMQQRLNNWRAAQPGAKKPFKVLKVDGSFGFADSAAVKIFQAAVATKVDGIVGPLTWAQLETVAGAVSQGTKKFDWRESVEGISNVGTTAYFDWEIKDGKVKITVPIKFTGASGHPMVNQWLQDIRDVWNNYKAVEDGVVGIAPREFPVEFNPVKSSSGFHKVRAAKPTKKDPNPRSDSANWYVNDTDKGLAPHEFGHLIGLEDEYNRPEEQSVAASGLEATVGQTKSPVGTSSTEVAKQINKVIVDGVNAGTPRDDIMGLVVAKLQEHQVEKGAFARLVAVRYGANHGFEGLPDMASYLAAVNSNQWTSNLTWATQVFLVSNESLMGTMGGLTGGQGQGTDFAAIPGHQHPVQPRHIRAFANLLTEAIPGTAWKPARR